MQTESTFEENFRCKFIAKKDDMSIADCMMQNPSNSRLRRFLLSNFSLHAGRFVQSLNTLRPNIPRLNVALVNI